MLLNVSLKETMEKLTKAMILSDILNSVHAIQVLGKPETKEIELISIDSRLVTSKSIFVAIRGEKTDGHKFIQSAVVNGAVAIVLDRNEVIPDEYFIHNDCVKILVNDSRKALAEIATAYYDNPSRKMNLVGITGTKGKTTTAFFIKHLFDKYFSTSGLIGTIANYVGEEKIKTMLTTPQAHEINDLLNCMVDKKINNCVMEVSSHALALNRVDNLSFNIAVFMNLTSDHMDYHETKENYLKSKKILFDMLSEDSFAVYNIDDPNSEEIIKDTKAKKVSFGMSEKATVRIENLEYDINGTRLTIRYEGKSFPVNITLVGTFNAYNTAAAFTVGVLSGISPSDAAAFLSDAPQVPGRMEIISKGNKKVIIDYSHTADSLKQALTAIHHFVTDNRKVYTVFGCGGDRDKTKRPVMGDIATSMSDFVFVTSDNPRTEDPFQIIDDIKKGIRSSNYKTIENREEAIKAAVTESPDNAVVLIAGKGHETYQEINGVRSHFDDKEIAGKYLNA